MSTNLHSLASLSHACAVCARRSSAALPTQHAGPVPGVTLSPLPASPPLYLLTTSFSSRLGRPQFLARGRGGRNGPKLTAGCQALVCWRTPPTPLLFYFSPLARKGDALPASPPSRHAGCFLHSVTFSFSFFLKGGRF